MKRATHRTLGQVMTKTMLLGEMNALKLYLREIFAQTKVSHPGIIPLLDVLVGKNSDRQYEVVLVFERFENSLRQEIYRKRDNGEGYYEHELWNFLIETANALSAAQELVLFTQGFCHRNIQPKSIYLSSSSEYKIGNFTSSKQHSGGQTEASITGDINYQSPEMRKALNGTDRAVYNPYKSDVYALGMTVLAMSMLNTFEIAGEVIGEEVERWVGRMEYSEELKRVVGVMLEQEEQRRPDCVELREMLKGRRELEEEVDRMKEEMRVASDATAQLASSLENLWIGTLLSKYHISKPPNFRPPQFYLRKFEVVEILSELGAYDVISRIQKYDFPYIPITEFVTEETGIPPRELFIHRKTPECDFRAITKIGQNCGRYDHFNDESELLFSIRKEYSLVTISEPATPTPTVLIQLPAARPVPVSLSQLFRIGDYILLIQSLTSSSITIQCSSVESDEPIQTKSFSAAAAPVLIGRDGTCHINLSQKAVSLKHAEVRVCEGYWVIVDQQSRNGTWMYCHKEGGNERESEEVELGSGQVVNYQYEYFRVILA